MSPSVETAQQPAAGSAPKGKHTDDERVYRNEQVELGLADKQGAPDVYISAEKDTEWYLWTGSIYVKPLRFENRSGLYVIALKTEPHAELGKHRHRGMVKAVTIRGPWGYHEYDWVGQEGDYITESPGTIHTLYMGANSHVVFDVMGSIEFFNDDNTLREIMDGFSFWRMYVEHCEKKGITPNQNLWY